MEKEIIEKKEMNNSPAELIRSAITGGADLEKLEKLLELQERWEANEARKEYNQAMSRVHSEIPIIAKSLENEQTHSKYAALSKIIFETKKIYTREGFFVALYEGETNKPAHVRVMMSVAHKLGHKETFYYDVPLDGKGIKGNVNMTPIHAKASSVQYGHRYLLCLVFSVPTGDDNDGNTMQPVSGKPTVAMPQAKAPEAVKDIPETEEMNQRAAVIADEFQNSENLLVLEEARRKHKEIIRSEMSNGYKAWLKQEYFSVKEKLIAKGKAALGE